MMHNHHITTPVGSEIFEIQHQNSWQHESKQHQTEEAKKPTTHKLKIQTKRAQYPHLYVLLSKSKIP
jgi:hypothetical protein